MNEITDTAMVDKQLANAIREEVGKLNELFLAAAKGGVEIVVKTSETMNYVGADGVKTMQERPRTVLDVAVKRAL
jgi:hypothetical protein